MEAVLPEGGEGLVMDMETLRSMRSESNKVRQNQLAPVYMLHRR